VPEKRVDCGKQAKKCLRLAYHSSSLESKAHFEWLAKAWMKQAADRLALLAEDERPPRKRRNLH
jgi:hypothetical protein